MSDHQEKQAVVPLRIPGKPFFFGRSQKLLDLVLRKMLTCAVPFHIMLLSVRDKQMLTEWL
jgi:hypothetical protein